MQEIEKKQKSSIEKAFGDKNRLAMLTKKDMADKFISKWISGKTAAQILESNRKQVLR